jgi:methyl-accepting chemotaxis protein
MSAIRRGAPHFGAAESNLSLEDVPTARSDKNGVRIMNNFSLKAKLALLVGVGILALLIVGAAGLMAARSGVTAVQELDEVRLPSIIGLGVINDSISNTDGIILSTAIWENDYQAQSKFAEVLKRGKESLARLEKGWKIYEPLPQTPE